MKMQSEVSNGSRRCKMRGAWQIPLGTPREGAALHLSIKSEDLPTRRQRARAGCTDA